MNRERLEILLPKQIKDELRRQSCAECRSMAAHIAWLIKQEQYRKIDEIRREA